MDYLRALKLPGTMKIYFFLLLIGCITMSACNNSSLPPTIVADTIAVDTIENAVEVASKAAELTYIGTLPCADCSGILTEITFHPDSLIYNISETYQGTPDGDRTYESSGKYVIIKGTATESEAVVFQLNAVGASQPRFFKQLGDSGIKMLDNNKNEIETALNYVLVRK